MNKKKNIIEEPIFFLFTCVKNGRKYIGKLFESLLLQTKFNFVHYIYDDGSEDPIDDLVDTYKEKVSKLKKPYQVIYEKNEVNIGLNMATKHCISKCFLPFFIWIDCDNWVDKNFFEELEILHNKNKNAHILRTKLVDGITNEVVYDYDFYLKNLYKKNQLKSFLNDTYAYCFFAVNYNFYCSINPIFIDDRAYFNDQQVLLNCFIENAITAYSSKCLGYFLNHDDNENILFINRSIDERFKNYAKTCQLKENRILNYIDTVLSTRKLLNEMIDARKKSPKIAWKIYFKINKLYRKNKTPKYLRYKYGNKFHWFLVLMLSSITYPIIK